MQLTDLLRLSRQFVTGATIVLQSAVFSGCNARQDVPTTPPTSIRYHQLTLELINEFYELSDSSDALITELLTEAAEGEDINLEDFYTRLSELRELIDTMDEMNIHAVRRADACLDSQEFSDLISRDLRRLLWLNTRTTAAGREDRFYELAIILSGLPEHSECDGLSVGMRLPSGTIHYRQCSYSRRVESRVIRAYKELSTHIGSIDYNSAALRQYLEVLEGMYELSENRNIHIETTREIRADTNSAARRLLSRYVRDSEENRLEADLRERRENIISLAELIGHSDPLVRCLEDEQSSSADIVNRH